MSFLNTFMSTFVKWSIGILVFVSIYLTVSSLYNLFFHPLRKFPGPPLARVSRLWSRIGNFQGRKSERIHNAHLQYGPVVRVGPNELSFAGPGAVREIYNSDLFIKEESFYRAKRIFHEDFLLSFRNPEAHKQRRKLLSRGFSQSAMLAFEVHVDTKIAALLDQWTRLSVQGQVLDVFPWTHWLGFDIVYHLLFDEDPGSVKYGRSHEVMPYFRAWKPTFIYKEFVPQLERYGIFVPGSIGSCFRGVETWKRYAEEKIEHCRDKDTKTPFLKSILHGEQDAFLGRSLTNSEIAEECMGGMFGGSGTTANTFIYLLWASLQRPEVVARLKDELKSAFPDGNTVPDYLTCKGLPYLQAVINETLRRYPTIVATLPRTATQDTMVQGLSISQGIIVGTQNYTIHRFEAAFPDPEEWRPERWLETEDDKLRKQAWTPFSSGSRKCIGINLAQMELLKITAAFFRRFDATIDPEMKADDMRMYDTFNAAPAGGKLLLRLSESAS